MHKNKGKYGTDIQTFSTVPYRTTDQFYVND